MDRIENRMYLAIVGLITATLALAVFASTAAAAVRLGCLLLALLAAALAVGLLVQLRLRNLRIVARLRGVAYEDPLTGLPNRAYAEDHIDSLLTAGNPPPFALVIVEVLN